MPYNVLIVDDSRSMRRVIVRVLRLSGLDIGRCTEAGDGMEALELLQQESTDIVLADINMPKMNGPELLTRLRADPRWAALPVIIISTDRSTDRLDRMVTLGARAYLTKPFEPEALCAVMAEILQEVKHAPTAV